MNKEELLEEIKKLESRKSYGLVWEDKPEDVVEQCKTKIPIFSEDEKKIVEKSLEKPTNLLIEGDNYHALTVLNYTHRKSIDLIYIDPPYNTGAKDWKYNNDYVDENDSFRHSKWISMMNNRLRIAKNLLKDDGVLIATIDKYENGTLLILLAELFPTHEIITIVIEHNPKGLPSRNFSESHEYAHFVIPKGKSVIGKNPEDKIDTRNLRRAGRASYRTDRPTMFFPIYVKDGKVVRIGQVPDVNFHPSQRSKSLDNGEIEVWPIDDKGDERRWHFGIDSIENHVKRIEVKERKGDYQLYVTAVSARYKTVWTGGELDAGKYGTMLVKNIVGSEFPYPKSLFATAKCLETVIYDKENATVLDFFAGSETTGHAVALINQKYNQNHKFILCTNNEGGIAREITYPRIKNVIEGYGNTEGIPSNLRYYKTEFVDVESVHNVSDHKKIELTYQAGRMIALREDTLTEREKNDWWQIFIDKKGRTTAIYFKEDKEKLDELVGKISKSDSAALYIFSWGKNEYKNEFSEYKNIRVEDIPEPILEVYKEINKK
ncbi:MAG: site-specific DNA-methyltransferase [Patescibacteria group bacterium]